MHPPQPGFLQVSFKVYVSVSSAAGDHLYKKKFHPDTRRVPGQMQSITYNFYYRLKYAQFRCLYAIIYAHVSRI